jgi:hypothetical protein
VTSALGCRLSAFGLLLLALHAPRAAPAQPSAESREPHAAGLQVTLLTIGEGAPLWEKFGHNALWFTDPSRGIDVAYNWGIFDFAEPGFLRRFLSGDNRYWVEGYPGAQLVEYYRRSDRTITVQRLNFTPAQAERAYQFAQWNAREENKFYRYDYFRDNCSTRVRDVVDYALGGALKRATASTRVRRSYRSESVRLMDDMKLLQLGIFTALGQPADRPLTVWEAMFIPMAMRDAIRLVRVPAAGASSGASLVAQERVVYESERHRERSDPPTLWIAYLIAGVLLGAEFFAVGRIGRRTRSMDVVFRVEVALWAFLTGVLGLVLLLAWTSTRHVFWFRNENLLLFNPLSLFLAVAALASIWKPHLARAAAVLSAAIALASVTALLLKALPVFTQDNIALVLLILPPSVAIALGFRSRPVAAA